MALLSCVIVCMLLKFGSLPQVDSNQSVITSVSQRLTNASDVDGRRTKRNAVYWTSPELVHHPHEWSVPMPWTSALNLNPGETLFIGGIFNGDGKIFEVLLLTSPVSKTSFSEVALKVTVNLTMGRVICSYNKSNPMGVGVGGWSKGQSVKSAFRAGQSFDLRIRGGRTSKFEIWGFRERYTEFKSVLNVSSITGLILRGDASVDSVHWSGAYYQCPFKLRFDNGYATGSRLFLYGVPTGDNFTIAFYGDTGNVLFAMQAMLNPHVVRLNAYINEKWGKEEYASRCPFSKMIAFDVVIVNQPYYLMVFWGGERIANFAHRTKHPGRDYVKFHADGDVDITGIEVFPK